MSPVTASQWAQLIRTMHHPKTFPEFPATRKPALKGDLPRAVVDCFDEECLILPIFNDDPRLPRPLPGDWQGAEIRTSGPVAWIHWIHGVQYRCSRELHHQREPQLPVGARTPYRIRWCNHRGYRHDIYPGDREFAFLYHMAAFAVTPQHPQLAD